MADINSNIRVNIDTSGALASIKALQRQISAFHVAMSQGGAAANAEAAKLQQNLINSVNATGKFSASFQKIASTTESFTTALEKNKLTMGEYFRYAGGASKSFGKYFKTEMNTIQKVAVERVKTLQTQYIKLGRDASGALKAIAVRPVALDMKNLGTQTALAAQKQQLLNQLLKQGSTNLLNFGKNTQWAGRQLMVGFTIPLATLGMAATKTFQQMEEQAIRFRRVYGDSFTATAETDSMLKQIQGLAAEFTKYGVAVKDTMDLAAQAAASGKMGADLIAQVSDATRLAVLGNIDQQKALETTISLTNAFGTAAKDLRGEINFLNAVENQTVTSIDDLTTAIPKAAPVIQQLGGDVKDLTFFLTAMREGGINASEGANAIKSGLASLINPTKKASDFLAGFGINVNQIVEQNKGDVSKLVVNFAKALDTLDPLNRSRAIEQMFGKFQFARMSTLFQNVIKQGSQASKVLDLMGQGSARLGIMAQKELMKIQSSPLYKFQKAIEDFKKELAPVGEEFMKALTPLINFGTDILKSFNKLEPGVKQFIVNFTGIVAGLGPVLLMTFGLIANGVANLIKGFAFVKNVFNKASTSSTVLGETTHYMTEEQLKAASVAASLEQSHSKLTQAFTVERAALDALTAAYRRSTAEQSKYALPIPGGGKAKKKYASGTFSVPGPKGAGDIVPAMLSPGEAVIPARQASKHRSLITDIINGTLPGYQAGRVPTRLFESKPTKYVSEEQKAYLKQQEEKLAAIRAKNKPAADARARANRPEALFVNQSLISKLGLTGDSPIAKQIAQSSYKKQLFIGNTTGGWSEFRSSPAYNVLHDAGLRENRYKTVPATSFKDLMKKYKMSTYNAMGALVQYFSGGTDNVIDPKTGKPKKVRKESRARNTSSVQGILNMLRSHTGGRPRSWDSRLPKFEWEGMNEEISAGLMAAEQHMRSQGLPDSKISRNINNLRTIQLSHIKPESKMFDVAGRQRSLKIWRTGNIVPDSGIYNQYLKEIGDKKGFFDKIDPKQIAATSGISESSVRKSIAKFKAGEHPTTPGEYSALAAIGKQDTGSYAGAATSAAFKASNGRKGFFKAKSSGAFKLDPSLDALAEKNLNNLVNRATTNIQKLEGSSQAVSKANAKNEKALKNNTTTVQRSTAETKKATKATKKVRTLEERHAKALEVVTKAREDIANPANKKRAFNKSEIAANNLLLYGNPNGPTAEQRQSRRDAQAQVKASRVAAAQERKFAAQQNKKRLSLGRFGTAKMMGLATAGSLGGSMIGGDTGNLLSDISNTAFTVSMLSPLFKGIGKKIAGSSIGQKMIMPGLDKFGKFLVANAGKLKIFGGVVGVAATAITVAAELIHAEAQKQADITRSVVKVLSMTKKELDSLNEYFGTNAQKSSFRTGAGRVGARSQKQETLAEEFRKSDTFTNLYKPEMGTLKNLSDAQLRLTMQAKAADLIGTGIGQEQTQIIIDAMLQELGNKNIKIDVKNMTLDTPKNRKGVTDSAITLMTSFFKKIKDYTGTTSVTDMLDGMNFGEWLGGGMNNAPENLVRYATQFSTFMSAISGQFNQGIIAGKEFENVFRPIEEQFKVLNTDNPAAALEFMNTVIKNSNPTLWQYTSLIKNAADQMLVLKSASLGITIPPSVLGALQEGSGATSVQKTAARQYQRDAQRFAELMADRRKMHQGQITAINKSVKNLGKQEDGINDKYDKRLDLLDQIIAANDAIQKQQQGQLDMADALTKGDIFGAAKAMQQMRQDNAQYALDQQKAALEAARKGELAPVQKAQESAADNIENIQTKIDNISMVFTGDQDILKLLEGINPVQERYAPQRRLNKRFGLSPGNRGLTNVLGETGTNILDFLTGFAGGNASGGHIRGKGTGTSDDIPAMLSNGEYVIRAKAVKALGVSTLDKLNHAEKFAKSGKASKSKRRPVIIPRTPQDDLGVGYTGPRESPEFWDKDKRKNVIVQGSGDGFWQIAQRYLPQGRTMDSWWREVMDANRNSEGKIPRIYGNSKIIIPGFVPPPKKSGKPHSYGHRTDAGFGNSWLLGGENHTGIGGAGLAFMFAKGGLVGRYSDGGEVGASLIDDLGSMGSTLWDIATFYPRLWADVISQNPQGLQHELFQPLQPWEQPDYAGHVDPVIPKKIKKKKKVYKPVMPRNGVHPTTRPGTTGRMQVAPTTGSSTRVGIGEGFTKANGGLIGKYSNGGMVMPKYFANGGLVRGTDSVPAMLTPGEFVVKQPSVKKFGAENLRALNAGMAGKSGNFNNNANSSSNSVYNSYSVNLNVTGSNMNPDDIAKTVVREIRRIDAQNIRGVNE